MTNLSSVWVFSGATSRFTSGIFTSKDIAILWIEKNKLSGMLSNYPLDIGVYDWAIEKKLFEIKKDSETSPEFIQRFTCAGIEHYHFEDGNLD